MASPCWLRPAKSPRDIVSKLILIRAAIFEHILYVVPFTQIVSFKLFFLGGGGGKNK